MALLCMLAGCKSNPPLSVPITSTGDATKEGEGADAPVPITGVYLACQTFPALEAKEAEEAVVGCGFYRKSDHKKVPAQELGPVKWQLTDAGGKAVEPLRLSSGDSIWDLIFARIGKDRAEAEQEVSKMEIKALKDKTLVAGGKPTEFKALQPSALKATSGKSELDPQSLPQPLITEFVFNHVGEDTNEFIEVAARPKADLSHLTLLVIEGDAGNAAQGKIVNDFPLTSAGENGYWVTPLQKNILQNGSQTVLLVEGFKKDADLTVDTDKNGKVDVVKWSRVLDSFAIDDGDAGDLLYSTFVFKRGQNMSNFEQKHNYVLGGASRIVRGGKTEWMRNDFFGLGMTLQTPPSDPPLGIPDQAFNTPGSDNLLIK
jgi:hypothetical protein